MRPSFIAFTSMLMLALGVVPSVAGGDAGGDEPKVVVPFDFQSKFDDGKYGQTIGDMVWKKLDRQGRFVIPEVMLDVRETLESLEKEGKLSADTPMDQVERLVKDRFDAQIAIWGSVERVQGNDWDVYDLKIRCVDFSAKPKPKVIYSVDARTKTVSEIPHKYLAAMFDALYEKKPPEPLSPDQVKAIAENWAKNPNLVKGGDFQTASTASVLKNVPLGWDTHGGQLREPVGHLVQWQKEKGEGDGKKNTEDKKGKNRFIRLAFDKSLGDTFGVMYYSDPFPVTEGATYRFECRWRTDGPKAKIFVKCYDEISSEYHEKDKPSASSGSGSMRLREVYRNQQNLKGPVGQWNHQTEDFTPKHAKYTPRWCRVMLYGYLGAGNIDFDDVVIKEIVDRKTP